MGIDAGFDMVPPLSKGVVDRHKWNRFINTIKDRYKDDTQVEVKPNYINFKAGEHPMLPFEGHKFLRFSSKISGPRAADTSVDSYIDIVTRVAKVYFGSRVQYWNECGDQYGHYGWKEVHESIRSYEQPDEPGICTGLGSLLNGTDPLRELDIPLFEVKNIPGRGRGLVARFNIAKGTRILSETPLFTVQSMALTALELVLATKLRALSRESQRQYLSLHNNFPGKRPFSGIFKTNALPCEPGSPVGGVYPTVCLINHSCIPNAIHSWNGNTEQETIHAVRPIKAGEEITIGYKGAVPYAVRQAELKESFGFECSCSGCSLPPSELQASDARRLRIQALDEAIGDPIRMIYKPKESLDNCHALLQALEEEYHGCAATLVARVYYDAFQVSIVHGDQARASVFAEKAYKARVVSEGEDSPETQRVKSLALKPADHSSFGYPPMKWKTTRDMVPKGLDTAQFEKWLFRK